jgi:hypothetical protein
LAEDFAFDKSLSTQPVISLSATVCHRLLVFRATWKQSAQTVDETKSVITQCMLWSASETDKKIEFQNISEAYIEIEITVILEM